MTPNAQALPAPGTASPWPRRRRQILAILRFELRRTLLGRRALLLYLAALAPVALMGIYAAVLSVVKRESFDLVNATRMYGGFFQVLILRAVVFFGCVWLFMNLIRGEVLDRSLHYYLLAPVRRDVLLFGKYVAGVLTAFLLFGSSTALSYLLVYVPFGATGLAEHFGSGSGPAHLATYLGIVLLGCIGYGALFLLMGLLMRNPIIPALCFFLWESLELFLHPILKRLTVTHYLKSLFPVPEKLGPFSIPSDPPAAWVAILGLLVFATALLAIGRLRMRRMEIDYSSD